MCLKFRKYSSKYRIIKVLNFFSGNFLDDTDSNAEYDLFDRFLDLLVAQ